MRTDLVSSWLGAHRPGYTLPGPLYTSDAAYRADLDEIWYREWVFAGHESELARPGAYLTLQLGEYPLVVLRGRDGELRALHNVCRHRGALLCGGETGRLGRRIVCPYHQWSYHLDGSLGTARSAPEGIDPAQLGLGRAHCVGICGLVFVSLAGTTDDAPDAGPPDPGPIRDLLTPYLAPYDLGNARVAHTSTIVEQGNWKLVMENNRECFHCGASHPELSRTFPLSALHSGGGSAEDLALAVRLVDRCQAAGLPGEFRLSPDQQYRVMRMPFVNGATSMTVDGLPASTVRFPGLPDIDVGDVLTYHYPSTWMHVMGDHAVTFRILPHSPGTTELRTSWLVPGAADEGVDYDLERLTEVWLATNAQDGALVARTQTGVSSPAFRPGPYSPVEEDGVMQFLGWYTALMRRRLGASVPVARGGTDGDRVPVGHDQGRAPNG
jgi:Rieske 2Fe-2S family protein